MFFVYLLRELRRRRRQAVFISLGLALGVGLVITVTATSAGVRDAQSTVLHSLYGVGTDVTVTQPAAKGSGAPAGFQIRQEIKSSFGSSPPSAGTKFSKNLLVSSADSRLRHEVADGPLQERPVRPCVQPDLWYIREDSLRQFPVGREVVLAT